MEQKSLFPARFEIDLVVERVGEKCPCCGENRVTDCIHGHVTFLCGASKRGKEFTKCEGDRWLGFLPLSDNGNPPIW